jgi:hypothetical protein
MNNTVEHLEGIRSKVDLAALLAHLSRDIVEDENLPLPWMHMPDTLCNDLPFAVVTPEGQLTCLLFLQSSHSFGFGR